MQTDRCKIVRVDFKRVRGKTDRETRYHDYEVE